MTTTQNEPVSFQPALRLVSTKGMSREKWLSVRKQGIGSSDAAAAVGINPYQSPLELWMNKTGRDAGMPQPDADGMDSPLHWGNVLEPIIAEQYSKFTGRKVRRVNAVLQHPDVDKHWMLANLDYAIVGDDEVQILECKTAGEFGARLWRDGVPAYVQCQVQHQMAVTGKRAVDVCVLLCGNNLRVYRVERDDAVIAALTAIESEFWSLVEADVPPKTDGSESSGRALQSLYPRETGETVDFSDDEAVSSAFSRLLAIRLETDALKRQEASLKQTIQSHMGLASTAIFRNGTASWKRSKDSVVLDSKTLLVRQPELLQQFPLVKQGVRRFTVQE